MVVRRLRAAVVGAALVGAGMAAVVAPGAALAAKPFVPGVPMGLSVARSSTTDVQVMRVSWKTVAKSDHYDVLVSDGTTETVYTAGPNATFLDVATANCASYQVRVGARNAAGAGGTTKPTSMGSVGPGPVTSLQASRTGDGSTASVTWRGQSWGGYKIRGNPNGKHDYRPVAPGENLATIIDVVRDSDGAVVYTRGRVARGQLTFFGADLAKLAPAQAYTVRVSLTNDFGSCNTQQIHIAPSHPA